MAVASNSIDAYNPTFYAQEALMVLHNALGMASRVYRAYEAERNSYGLGNTIQVRKPSDLSVSTGGTATPHDLVTSTKTITLDQWKQVKISLTDQEIAKSGERIIEEHIQPAAYQLANNVDSALGALWVDIGNSTGQNAYTTSSTGFGLEATHVTNARRELAKMASEPTNYS